MTTAVGLRNIADSVLSDTGRKDWACVMAMGVQDRLLVRFIISDARSVHHNVIISLADAPDEEGLREALKKELTAIESR
jgi:hypothetical protein